MKIFEAIPNISEGRDIAKIKNIATALTASLGNQGKLLDIHSDRDHNRSVFTYIGTEQAITRASLALIKKALALIDLTKHAGIHPYSGVVDVLPIVALDNHHQLDAVTISQQIGKQAHVDFGLPNYFYEEASPDKVSLPALRKVLREQEIIKNHPKSGVLITGARDFMVAYNINLLSQDLALAKEIATKMREKNSGLPGVRALGLKLAQQQKVQVSMNLTKPFLTTTKIVYNTVKSLLQSAGYPNITTEEELIGLLPEDVLAAAHKLRRELDG